MSETPNKYKSLSQVQHVQLRPNLYVGSVVPILKDAFIWDPKEKQMVYQEGIPYCEGLVKLFDEAIDNAIDNSIRDDDPTTVIKVALSDREFSVKNDGKHIPIDPMEGSDSKLIPHVIFGECLSGSNFNEERESIGANGLGIKLCNIMSDNFSVTCYDKEKQRTFNCTWRDGMGRIDTWKTTATKKVPLLVTEVRFRPTLTRFNNNPDVRLKSIVDMTPWVFTRLVQLAATHPNKKIKVYFNGELIRVRDFKSYMKCFPSKHTFYANNPKQQFEYGVSVSSTGAYEHQSFVNCQFTPSPNSTHTKYVTNAVVKIIRDFLSNKHKGATLTTSAISSKLNIFVNLRIKNPGFTSQTKIELSSPISSHLYPIDKGYVLGVLKKSGVIKQLEDTLNSKVMNGLAKQLNGSKARNVNVEKYDSAHSSGTIKSRDCTLFIVEGDSAKTMVTTGMSVIGRQLYGVFPIRGKLLNVRGASPGVLKGNKEVQNIMKILGLNFSKKYDTWQDRETLRYGRLCVLTDADVDGHHITGLLINFIIHFWPALAEHFFVRFVTPIIKVSRGKQAKHFFNLTEFEQWRKSTPQSDKFFVQHLKGLGTSERADTISYFRDLASHLKTFKFSPNTYQLTENIFGPKQIPWRKKWLTERGDGEVQPLDYKSSIVPVDDFYNSELYEFSRSDIVRSIPSVVDGLKKSQRQALCGSLHHFEKTSNRMFKVAQLSGVIAAHTKYAHGETSLQDTIVNMAQDFCGSNNMPLFNTHGAFGSRMQSGRDAASARYIYTSLRTHTRKLFLQADDDILTYTLEEGSRAQPDFYVPTLPLLLLNGSHGIGTGFATKLPCFNPGDIVRMVRARIDGQPVEEPLPFYTGYSTNHLTRSDPSKWIFTGTFERISARKIAITELPVGTAIEGYKEKVLDRVEEDGGVKRVIVAHVDENSPRFEIELDNDLSDEQIITKFRLSSTFTRNCMYFLDSRGKVKQYTRIVDIVDDWLAVKLEYTEKRRQTLITVNDQHLGDLELKIKFLRAVAEDRIVLAKRTRTNIRAQMQSRGIPETHHEKFLAMSLGSISSDRIAALENEAETIRVTLGELRGTTAGNMYLADLNELSGDTTTQKRARDIVSGGGPQKKQKVKIVP